MFHATRALVPLIAATILLSVAEDVLGTYIYISILYVQKDAYCSPPILATIQARLVDYESYNPDFAAPLDRGRLSIMLSSTLPSATTIKARLMGSLDFNCTCGYLFLPSHPSLIHLHCFRDFKHVKSEVVA